MKFYVDTSVWGGFVDKEFSAWTIYMKRNNKAEQEFHAVEFMRQARTKLTEQFLLGRQKYLDFLKRQ